MLNLRIGSLLAFCIALLALVWLALGLSQIEFQPGTKFTAEKISELRILLVQFKVYRGLFFLLIGIIIISVFLFSKQPKRIYQALPKRKNTALATLIQLLFWIVAITLLRKKLLEGNFQFFQSEVSQITNQSNAESIPLVSSSLPDWITFLSSFILLLILTFGLWRIFHRRRRSEDTLELIAREAKVTMEAIKNHGEIRNVILKCYVDMNQILKRRRGIQRKQGMTPREFERSLVELGLPEEPVIQLTRLFEAARYGASDLSERAEMIALACLDVIVQTSGGDL